MGGALAAGGAAVAVADLWLTVVSLRHETVLGVLLGSAGIGLVAFAIASGPSGSVAEGALVAALIFLGVGVAINALGQLVEGLLDDEGEHDG